VDRLFSADLAEEADLSPEPRPLGRAAAHGADGLLSAELASCTLTRTHKQKVLALVKANRRAERKKSLRSL